MRQYCGEEGEKCLLKGAVVCSNPFNLEVSNKMMQNSLIGKEVYLRAMGSKYARQSEVPRATCLSDILIAAMKSLIETHEEALKKHSSLDPRSIKSVITYLHDFDREVQYVSFFVSSYILNLAHHS